MLTGVDPDKATLMLAEHVKVIFEPGHGRGRLFPNSDASVGDDCNEQRSALFMNSLAFGAFGPPGLSFSLSTPCKAGPA